MKFYWKKTLFLPILALCLFTCIKPDKEQLVISSGNYSIDISAVQSEPFELYIEANFIWTIECSATWLNFSPSKASGDKKVLVSASPNTSLEMRKTSFFIVGEKVREEIQVTQQGEEPALILRENSRTIGVMGGEIEVILDSNVDLDITPNVPWITRITTKLMSQSSYYFTVEQNLALTTRTGTITFKHKNGQMSQEYTVSQAGETPEIIIAPNALAFEAEGGIKGVEVTSNVPWKVTIEGDKTWVTRVQSVQTKLMETTLCLFSVAENTLATSREATVSISRDGASEPSRLVTITQAAAAPTISFTPEAYNEVPAAGTATNQKLSIKVEANFAWTVDHSQTASWVTDIDYDTSTCSFKVSAHVDLGDRTTQITFKRLDGSYSKSFSITQIGSEPWITVLPLQTAALNNAGGEDYLFVSANVPWEFTAEQSWLYAERGFITSGGVVNDYIKYSAPSNTGSVSRSATITIFGGAITKTVTITQEAGDAQIIPWNDVFEMPAEETTVPLTVTSNVLWDHTKNVSWIEVKRAPATKAPLSDSTVLVTVEKNTSLVERQGVITLKQVNGTVQKTVTIYQAGASPAYTITPSENKRVIQATGDDLTLIIDANFPVAYVGADAAWVVYEGANPDGRRFSFTIRPTTFKEYRSSELSFRSTDGTYHFRYTVVQKGATISTADSLVLIRVYTGLSGVVWRDQWNLSEPVSQWFGVTLSDVIKAEDGIGKPGERLVTGISLPSNGLLGRLEGGIIVARIPFEELIFLQHLDLSGNYGISGELPARLRELKYLRELNLSSCNFSNSTTGRNIPPEWGGTFGGLPCFSALTKLKVNNNSLSGEVPDAVYKHVNWDLWEPTQNILPQRSGQILTLPPPPPEP